MNSIFDKRICNIKNFFSYKTYFEDVAAFANEVDLKTLKATNVSHKDIYPEMWRIAKKLLTITLTYYNRQLLQLEVK